MYTFVLDSFLAPFASWIMIQRNIAHYTVSTYYINDCQWCLKWKAWTCPQLLWSTLVSQKNFPTKLCSVRFPWPTRQEISFFLWGSFLNYFGVAFYEILEMFRTRYSYCSGWLAIGSNCLLYKCKVVTVVINDEQIASQITIRQFSVNLNPHLGMICHDQWAISIHEFGINLESWAYSQYTNI